MSEILPTIRSYFPWYFELFLCELDGYIYIKSMLVIYFNCMSHYMDFKRMLFSRRLFSQWMQLWHFKLVWMKVHGRFEGNLRLQVPGKVVAECGLRLVVSFVYFRHVRRSVYDNFALFYILLFQRVSLLQIFLYIIFPSFQSVSLLQFFLYIIFCLFQRVSLLQTFLYIILCLFQRVSLLQFCFIIIISSFQRVSLWRNDGAAG